MPQAKAVSPKSKRSKTPSKEMAGPKSAAVIVLDDESQVETKPQDPVVSNESSDTADIVAVAEAAIEKLAEKPVEGPGPEVPNEAIPKADVHPDNDQHKDSSSKDAPAAPVAPATSDTALMLVPSKTGEGSDASIVNGTHQEEVPSDALAHLPLNRHIYFILDDSVRVGTEISPAPYQVERAECPYHDWPLYNDFKKITKVEGTWPPAFVNLQDWHVDKILQAGIPHNQCRSRWPADFSGKGKPHDLRKPKGRAAKVKKDERFYYKVVFGNYQLSGDEGSQAVVLIPSLQDGSGKTGRKEFSLGQECVVQEIFVPSVEELKLGTLMSRIGSEGLRPLNNRDDWGPESRVQDVPKRRGGGGKKKAQNGTSDNQQDEEFNDDTGSSFATGSSKRSGPDTSEGSRKVAKTKASESPSSSAGKAKALTNGQASASKANGRSAAKEKSEEMGNLIVVKAGVFNKTPRTQEGPVLTLAGIQETSQYNAEVLDNLSEMIKNACRCNNHDVAVSHLLAADSLLKAFAKSSNDFFEKACAEAQQVINGTGR